MSRLKRLLTSRKLEQLEIWIGNNLALHPAAKYCEQRNLPRTKLTGSICKR